MRVHEFQIHSDIERNRLIEIPKKTSQFISDVNLILKGDDSERAVDAKSLLGMLSMPLKAGTTICLISKGKDEEEACNYVYQLFQRYV